MIEEFTILSIDDRRKEQKEWIASRFVNTKRIFIECVDGRNQDALRRNRDKFGIQIHGGWKLGELGIWFSTLNAWEYAANNNGLLIFEDDAIPVANFEELVNMYVDSMPDSADYIAIWTPENQLQDYQYNAKWDIHGIGSWDRKLPYEESIYNDGHPYLARVYQGYGGVCLYVTKRGASKLIERALSTGINTPVDCFYYQQAHGGFINGLAIKPEFSNIVGYCWDTETTIHKTEWRVLD